MTEGTMPFVLTDDEAWLYETLYRAHTEPDQPFNPPFAVRDSISLYGAAHQLADRGLLTFLPYSSRDRGWLWETDRGTVVTTRGCWVYGQPLREAYQAWREAQEDEDW